MKILFMPPNWLRWAVLIPCALSLGAVSFFALSPLFDWAIKMMTADSYRPSRIPEWVGLFVSGVIPQYLCCWVAQQISPTHKSRVLKTTAGISFVVMIFFLSDNYVNSYRIGREDNSLRIFGAMFGAVYAWITIKCHPACESATS